MRESSLVFKAVNVAHDRRAVRCQTGPLTWELIWVAKRAQNILTPKCGIRAQNMLEGPARSHEMSPPARTRNQINLEESSDRASAFAESLN